MDICSGDLTFAVQNTAPPQSVEHQGNDIFRRSVGVRWEDLTVRLWEGGLEVINEKFADVECIISTEVSVQLLRALNRIVNMFHEQH